jgi:hypothetical protein
MAVVITPDPPVAGTLLDFNASLAAALSFLNLLNAQLDGLLSLALGPFQALLAAQLNASLAAQASLTLQVSDPLAAIRALLQALAQLQASLAAALALPTLDISIGAELTASIALAAALQVQLGLIDVLIKAALSIKLPAVKLAAQLNAALQAGPFFAFGFDADTAAEAGTKLDQLIGQGGLVDPTYPSQIDPTDPVVGLVFVTNVPSLKADLQLIFPFIGP